MSWIKNGLAAGGGLSEREKLEAKADSWNPPRFLGRAGDYEKLEDKEKHHKKLVDGFLNHYGPLAERLAEENAVPSRLLLALIANEQVFYTHAEHFAERFGAGSSIGLAQIQPDTLHGHGFYMWIRKEDLKKKLKKNSFNIEAASKLLGHHLGTLCEGLTWREAGIRDKRAASDSFVEDILEGEDSCSAQRVCALLDKNAVEMDQELESDPKFQHCMMKAAVAFWISGDTIIYRREIEERRPNTMKRSRDGARLIKDFSDN